MHDSRCPSARLVSFIIYVAIVLSAAMLLFPPFTGYSGTEYAFLLSGPSWLQGTGAIEADLGLGAQIYWAALIMQLVVVWAIALGANWFLRGTRRSASGNGAALVIGCASLLIVPDAFGQRAAAVANPDREADVVVGAQEGKYGIGTGSSWPAYGLSGTYRYSDQITAELILGALGTVQSIGGRAWYRFQQSPTYDLYGFANVGIYRYDYGILNTSETVIGIGGGAGVEWSWAKILKNEDFPPIYSNIDLGLTLASFEYYNFSALSFGGGIHYRFGGK